MNNIFVSWKQKIESRIISDLKSQYTESEEQIRQRKEQFLKKQKKIILIEIIAGAVFLAFLIIRAAFLQDDILLSRNSFGQGSKDAARPSGEIFRLVGSPPVAIKKVPPRARPMPMTSRVRGMRRSVTQV